MIPERAIIEWRKFVPWIKEIMVEQDLIICRSLVAIYNDEFLSSRLAFRGGTALENKSLNADNVIKCYHRYISFSDGESPSRAVYLANMEEKLQEDVFLQDAQAILRPSLIFNPQEAYEVVKKELIEKLF